MITAMPHFEHVPRLPASLAGALMRCPLSQWNVIVPAAPGPVRGTILVFSSDMVGLPAAIACLKV
jgi:hypothetical protein